MRPEISVLIPARNEKGRIAPTIQAIARARTTGARVEFVVVDDASTDHCLDELAAAAPRLLEERKIDIRACRLNEHSGNYRARNQAAAIASADVLFITDAHVQFSAGWDELVLRFVRPDRVLAGTTVQRGTGFRGYGCRLLVPLMSTSWNRDRGAGLIQVPIAACHATALPRDLFMRLGGYDPGMIQYGGGEPEFSVRAWLQGAEILALADLEVYHEFKGKQKLSRYLAEIRTYWVHNCLRFGLLYLNEPGCLQLLRYHALAYPAVFQAALSLVHTSDVWQRRDWLEGRRSRPFEWFVSHFGLKDQGGGDIL